MASVPYWSQACQLCGGYIADPLLECAVPPANMTLEEWAKKYRFQQPGTNEPLENYPYAP